MTNPRKKTREHFAAWLVMTALTAACSRDLRGENGRDVAIAAERVLGAYEAAAQTRELLQRVGDSAWRLDAAALYAALPDAESAEQERNVVFEAREKAGRRFVDHRVARSSVSQDVGTEPGDGWLLLGAMPLADRSGDYRVRVADAVSTGKADCFRVWKGLPEDLRGLERNTLIESLQREFPRTVELALRYLEVETASRALARRGHAVEVALRARLDALRADFPHLADYLKRLAKAGRGSGALQTTGGATLVSWSFREPNDELKIALRSADGRLVADDEAEPPVDLLQSQRLPFVYSTSMEAYGVRTRIEGIHGTVRTDPNREAAEIQSQVSGEPDRLSVEGALFGVVPVAAVDFFVPGALAGSVRRILSTLLRGRDGQGIEIATTVRAETAQTHSVGSRLASDVPAGRFARLALRLAASLVQADERERAELLQLGRDLAGRLRADLSESG